MKKPQFLQLHHLDPQAVREELLAGLRDDTLQGNAHISPKFLYDSLGSTLFSAITELPEYYPTRTEAAIFTTHGADIASQVPRGSTLIDLGAGDCAKAASLFALLRPSHYIAVDISVEYLRDAMDILQLRNPGLDMVGIGQDFSQSLELPDAAFGQGAAARVLFYPGSSIGNFTPAQALYFLQQVHSACGTQADGGILIGVDLVKDAEELRAAYDDALGVTAAFNRNLLLHVNRIASTNFSIADWAHVALYNQEFHRIEMHLQALRDVKVQWPQGGRTFAKGDRIHTENSYKWTVSSFVQLIKNAGFAEPTVWTDAPTSDQGRFAVLWAKAA